MIVQENDWVRTKTGRQGWVRAVSARSTCTVLWEDGEEFSIQSVHLEVLAHNCSKPVFPKG